MSTYFFISSKFAEESCIFNVNLFTSSYFVEFKKINQFYHLL